MVSRTISALKVFSAGCFVYFVMAACTASQDASSGGNVGASGTVADAAPGATSPVSNAMADDFYTSGSRLKVQTLEGSDGSKQFFGWFDSTRQEACNFGKTSDAVWRCIPSAALVLGSYYATASCSTPLAVIAKNAPTPSVASNNGDYFQAIAATTVWIGTPGSCIQAPATTTSAYNFFSLGPSVSNSTFADATLKTAP